MQHVTTLKVELTVAVTLVTMATASAVKVKFLKVYCYSDANDAFCVHSKTHVGNLL